MRVFLGFFIVFFLTDVTKSDCRSLYGVGERKDGIYTISPDEITSFPVYCDMTNGGWTVIQRRIDGEVNFDRVWVDYARGFGNLSADFWLGLRYIHLLASDLNEISFELTIAESGRNASAVYKNFTVDDEAEYFRMHVSREAVYNNEMSLYIDNRKWLLSSQQYVLYNKGFRS
ncbi:hypothetical protein KUTeg_024246 [Tegillarca granosa]|uniref:Fibrinogen C-terminal domain-containing protein n=1 Tax=Tegillarca granosa TaxID=220873 RepID=A0ABQ9E2J7_TEGGR|nr:hypothetical protein KUTeg_024246 [Tegillarca granosa]